MFFFLSREALLLVSDDDERTRRSSAQGLRGIELIHVPNQFRRWEEGYNSAHQHDDVSRFMLFFSDGI